jgi:predicted nuclease of restriction endonuclease-like (RecB) superfamily
MSPDLFYRDPYILDFLGLKDTYSEKEMPPKDVLEQKLLQAIENAKSKGAN